jgi:hypothetical protein
MSVFPSIESATSFEIDYKVFAEGARPVKTGTLSIKVLNPKKQDLA